MAVHQSPAYLTLIRPDSRPAHQGRRQFDRFGGAEMDPGCGVATRRALLERLETVGTLAPAAPLSFVLVHVAGIDSAGGNGPSLLAAAARTVVELTRPVDMVGRLTDDAFGIVLQGTGATGAAAVAARLAHHLNLGVLAGTSCHAIAAAATGTGRNHNALPSAVLDSVSGR